MPPSSSAREVISVFLVDSVPHSFRHKLQHITFVNPRYSLILDRKSDWTAFHIKDENSFTVIGEEVEININLQTVNQPRSCPFRLLKSLTSDYSAWPFVRDAENEPASAVIRQSTAAPCSFLETETVSGFLELNMLSFLFFHELSDSI